MWIEILHKILIVVSSTLSLPSRECGLKYNLHQLIGVIKGHSLRGSVDWNHRTSILNHTVYSHSLRGSVDWNREEPTSEQIEALSLPSRECGLKLQTERFTTAVWPVTPFAGVWIEIWRGKKMAKKIKVTPFAGVWIEMTLSPAYSAFSAVTPFAGVWIEISIVESENQHLYVTPFAGVWIEILQLRRG